MLENFRANVLNVVKLHLKPKPKQLLRPITTRAGSAMNQSQLLAITCNSLEVQEKSRVHGSIGFCFDSHWLKNWRESFKPITKRSNPNHVITFDSNLKTALYRCALLFSIGLCLSVALYSELCCLALFSIVLFPQASSAPLHPYLQGEQLRLLRSVV